MKLQDHIIVGVHITDRVKHAMDVQNVLTEFGCNIKTRLGLHEVSGDFCSNGGILLLELAGDETRCRELAEKLAAQPGVEVQQMVFGH